LLLVLLPLLAAAGLWWGLGRNGTTPPSNEHLWFADVTDEVGIDFTHEVGDLSLWQLPQIHGSGVAVFDCDGDDRLDLYFLNAGGASCRLYKGKKKKEIRRKDNKRKNRKQITKKIAKNYEEN